MYIYSFIYMMSSFKTDFKSPEIDVNVWYQSFLTLPYFIYLTVGDIKREMEKERKE